MVDLVTSSTLNGGSISITVEASSGETETENIGNGSNTYTLSNIPNDASQYRLHTDISGGAQLHSSDLQNFVSSPSAPRNVTATVDANDQISVNWDTPSDWGGEQGHYDVQIQRDGGSWVSPAGGPSSPGSESSGETYGPGSDAAYNSQIGIDSSFRFRVRAENSEGNSGWDYSSTVYTDPIPPHNPSVSRPDGDTIHIEGEVKSDIVDKMRIGVREDTGDGYGSWTNFDYVTDSNHPQVISGSVLNKGSTFTIEYIVGDGQQTGITLSSDARYQFRLRSRANSGNRIGEWVYADYGNEGNVFFEYDFESGDLSNWDSSQLSDSQSGVRSDDPSGDLGISGPDQGSYHLNIDGGEGGTGDYAQKNLGDLSTESDVIVKCTMATGSMDNDTEWTTIDWYDGSSWQELVAHGHEYNAQGWVEVAASVPDSWLSTDNRVRLWGTGSLLGGDHSAFDRVVVSDILHEYTAPSQPTNKTSSGGNREATINWTDNATFNDRYEMWIETVGEDNYANIDKIGGNDTSYTYTDLLDGEQYEFMVRETVDQDRHGENTSWWYSNNYFPTAVTDFPSLENIDAEAQP